MISESALVSQSTTWDLRLKRHNLDMISGEPRVHLAWSDPKAKIKCNRANQTIWKQFSVTANILLINLNHNLYLAKSRWILTRIISLESLCRFRGFPAEICTESSNKIFDFLATLLRDYLKIDCCHDCNHDSSNIVIMITLEFNLGFG